MSSSSARPALPRNNSSTPIKQTTSQDQPVKESPGNWRHPRLAEITRRQSKNTFSETNIRTIVYNVGALAVLEVTRSLILPVVLPYWPNQLLGRELRTHAFWIFLGLALIPLLNIGVALLPLVRPRDDMPDIPLTPGQRKLLGLPSTGRPVASTPNSVYSTPPRYSRTPSLAGSPASIKSYTATAGSPLSNRGSPSRQQQQSSNSPYNSPSGASPLLQKAVAGGGGGGNGRRSSFGSPSPLGASTASSVFGDGPATPTPSGSGKRSSVSLNNKWLYEKGRRSSSNSWLHQGL